MTKLLTWISFLICISFPAFGKVVLLTSLDPALNRPPLRTKNWNINKKLEEIFRDKIDSKEEIIVRHLADQSVLWDTLNDEEVSALFWVSHSNSSKDGGESAVSTAAILDHQFRDVLPLFQKIPSHIKYLGLVGCRGELIVNELKKKELFEVSPMTKIFAEEKKVDARKSLKRAIKEFNESKLNENNSACIEKKAVRIHYKRMAAATSEAVRIVVNKQVVAVLKKLNAGEEQEGDLLITTSIASKNDLKILIDTGASSQSSVEIGKFEFTSDFEAHWKLFAKPDGTPFGIGSHIYQFKTQLPLTEIPQEIIEACN